MLIGVKTEIPIVARLLHNDKFFLIYENDNLESIVNRYGKEYPEDAKMMIADMEEEKKNFGNEKGFSVQLGILRVAQKIPIPVYYGMKFLDDDFWVKDNVKNYREFMSLCPKLCCGSV